MQTNRKLSLVLIVFFAFVSVVLVNHGAALATEAKIIKIEPVENKAGKLVGMFIDPKKLVIEKDTIVIWLSGIPGQEIQVIFEEGKTCQDVTADPYQFKLNAATSCYVTNWIPYGASSSLRFPESGTFDYVVTTEDGKMKFPGKLVIR